MWPLIGVLAAILIVVGVALLIAYAVLGGLMHRDLPGTIADDAVPTDGPSAAPASAQRPRTLGALGAIVLVVGLALGVAAFTAGGYGAGSGTGATGSDCAQSWNGCPQVTAPGATPVSSLPKP